MSGLFLRLAAQATGLHGAMLHSPARLPYQPLPERLEQPAPTLAAATRLAEDRQPLRMPADPAQPVAPPSLPALGPLASSPQERTVKSARVERLTPLPPQSSPANRHDESAQTASGGLPAQKRQAHAEISAPQDLATPAPIVPEKTVIGVQLPSPDARVAGEHALRPQAEPPRVPVSSNEVHASLRVPQQVIDTLVLPPPLLAANPLRATPAAAPAVPVAVQAAPTRDPDEVHIHIGRIEVTAIQESRPASKPSRKGAAPLSLDDYLARRKGDGR